MRFTIVAQAPHRMDSGLDCGALRCLCAIDIYSFFLQNIQAFYLIDSKSGLRTFLHPKKEVVSQNQKKTVAVPVIEFYKENRR